jgi:hypothetical protein
MHTLAFTIWLLTFAQNPTEVGQNAGQVVAAFEQANDCENSIPKLRTSAPELWEPNPRAIAYCRSTTLWAHATDKVQP